MIGATTYPFLWALPLTGALEQIASAGFRSVEILVSPPHLSARAPQAEVERLRRRIDELGLQVTSVNSPTLDVNVASVEPALRSASVDHYRSLTDIGVALGAKVVVVSSGRVHPLQSPRLEDIRSIAAESIAAIAGHAAGAGATVGLENLPYKLFETSDGLAELIDEIGDESLSIAFDCANAHGIEEVVPALRRHGDRISLIQASDSTVARWAHDEIGLGEIDFASFWPEVAAHGAPLIVELTTPADIEAQVRSRDALDGFAERGR